MWLLALGTAVLRARGDAREARPVVECTRDGRAVPCPHPTAVPVVLAKADTDKAAALLPEDLAKAMEYDYTLQYTSVDPALLSPLSPNDPFANRCLSSLQRDDVGGVGLGFEKCAHYPKVDDRGRPLTAQTAPNETILFNFFPDGKLRNKATGLCIRRVPCTAHTADAAQSMIYDLGACEEESTALFLTWKSTFGRADSTSLIGPPLSATATACGSCGPFLLKQLCGPQNTAISCGLRFSPPGWTKQRKMLRPKYEDTKEFMLSFAPSPRSLCGTKVQETPEASQFEPDRTPPWYYFHRYKDGELRKMGNPL